MSSLTPHECRVLGVLVEKAHTTPGQYPLSLNAVVTGANQKSNRDPVITITEDQAITAIDGLRAKGLIREVMLSGSRVQKFRHVARETLELSTSELVVLAELLLRGPQTLGELRGRATRMHPLESLEVTSNVLDHLMQREPPFVRSVPPAPGSRASRYAQLLCPELHRLDAPAAPSVAPTAAPAAVPTTTPAPAAASAGASSSDAVRGLETRLDRLEAEVEALRRTVHDLAQSAGRAGDG